MWSFRRPSRNRRLDRGKGCAHGRGRILSSGIHEAEPGKRDRGRCPDEPELGVGQLALDTVKYTFDTVETAIVLAELAPNLLPAT